MSEVAEAVEGQPKYKPLIENDAYYVLVSHQELDDLIGQLMHMFELNGDVEQRNALKRETKWKCRDWLDDLYEESGYFRDHTVAKDAPIHTLPKLVK